MSCQYMVRRHQMVVVFVGQRSDYGVLIGLFCKMRQVLANLHSGDGSRDRIELAADLGWRVRLHIERFMVTGCAGQPYNHNLFGAVARRVCCLSSGRLRTTRKD